jgi:hypothetical protein
MYFAFIPVISAASNSELEIHMFNYLKFMCLEGYTNDNQMLISIVTLIPTMKDEAYQVASRMIQFLPVSPVFLKKGKIPCISFEW